MADFGVNRTIKADIRNIYGDIENDIAAQMTPEFYQGKNIAPEDHSKLAFLDFVSNRVDYFIDPGEITAMTIRTQLENLRRLRFFTHTHHGRGFVAPPPKDYYDLEKSFRAYRLLYPALTLQPLQAKNYYLFREGQDVMLGLGSAGYKPDVEPEEISALHKETQLYFDKALNHIHESKDIQRYDVGRLMYLVDGMKENAQTLYGSVVHGKFDKPRYKASMLFGYAAFAMAHLIEDNHVPIEKRSFLVDQTYRALNNV